MPALDRGALAEATLPPLPGYAGLVTGEEPDTPQAASPLMLRAATAAPTTRPDRPPECRYIRASIACLPVRKPSTKRPPLPFPSKRIAGCAICTHCYAQARAACL